MNTCESSQHINKNNDSENILETCFIQGSREDGNDLGDSVDEKTVPSSPSNIRHLVLSGGGAYGLTYYGFLRESCSLGIWNIDSLKSVYGSSIGTILATVAILSKLISWEILDNYIIKRPWHQLFQFNFDLIVQCYSRKGLFGKHIIEQMFEPLLLSIDLSKDVSLAEFFEKIPVESHFIVAKLFRGKYELVNISYKTHPEWKLIDAIYSSCCLPVLFSPFVGEEGAYYIDGGFLCNYPINICIQDQYLGDSSSQNTDEILGLCISYSDNKECGEKKYAEQDENIFDYLFTVLLNIINHVSEEVTPIRYSFSMNTENIQLIDDIQKCVNSEEMRIQFIEMGANIAKSNFSISYGDCNKNQSG